MWDYRYSDELYHHGVKGMKWGVRRTDAQLGHDTSDSNRRKRQTVTTENIRTTKKQVDDARVIVNETKAMKKEFKKTSKSARKLNEQIAKDLEEMDDKELRERINRMNMEQQYSNLVTTKYANNGRDRVDAILDVSGKALVVTSSALSIALAIKQLRG